MKKFIVLVLLLPFAFSATYYVGTNDCSDSGPGTIGQPFCTIQHGVDSAQAGDTVYVRAGFYDERVSVSRSGSPGNYITIAGYWKDDMPVMRGFDIYGRDYIRITGFEIHQLGWQSPIHGIYINEGSSYIEILNNYMHHTGPDSGGQMIRVYPSDHVTIRGNDMSRGACAAGEGNCGCNGYGIGGHPDAHYMLVEYNHIHDIGSDFFDNLGSYTIGRNNYFHGLDTSIWSCIPHVDFFQPGSDGMATNVMYHVYESNVLGDNPDADSHALQMRDSTNTGDHDMIFRGNVIYNLGSYVQQAGGVDRVFHYNNAYHQTSTQHTSSWGSIVWHNTEQVSNPSIGNFLFNNIAYDTNGQYLLTLDGTSAGSGSEVDASDNICYQTHMQPECIEINPGFVDVGSNDLHLQQDSPAIGVGRVLTTTIGSGSGTTFNVEESGFFTDGFGMVDGDTIVVGTNNPVKITNIDGNTITVGSSITWNTGDAVNWRTAATDIGAYPYRDSYEITNTINYNSGTITATVNDESLVRFVEFWVDGIPVNIDYDAPFAFDWNEEGEHQLKAIARPLYADSNLGYEDLLVINGEPCNSVHDADTDCSGAVELDELIIYVEAWRVGSVTIVQLMEAINLWK